MNPGSAASQARYLHLFTRVASNPANRRYDAVAKNIITQDAAKAGVEAYTWAGVSGQVWVTTPERCHSKCRRQLARGVQMNSEKALQAYDRGDLSAASQMFEDGFDPQTSSLEHVPDLAVFYWQATDPGISAAAGLDAGFGNRASTRYKELLALAAKRFPRAIEPAFWSRFIAWADFGDPFDPSECLALLKADPDNLVPVIYLFMASGGAQYRAEAARLLRAFRDDAGARGRYIRSVLMTASGDLRAT